MMDLFGSSKKLLIATVLPFLCLCSTFAATPQTEEITIIRDDFGIPNIFAKTEEGAAYGMGYAQASSFTISEPRLFRKPRVVHFVILGL